MRVISGYLKGQNFTNSSNSTHPMSEKIRGGLFNILGDIVDLTLLDCYGGTGAISYEAISRGAKSAVVVESNKKAQRCITDNIMNLKLESKVRLVDSTVNDFIDKYHGELFDFIVCDPPFDQPIDNKTILRLEKLVSSPGLLILSLPINSINMNFEALSVIKEKVYGDARLVFFRRKI